MLHHDPSLPRSNWAQVRNFIFFVVKLFKEKSLKSHFCLIFPDLSALNPRLFNERKKLNPTFGVREELNTGKLKCLISCAQCCNLYSPYRCCCLWSGCPCLLPCCSSPPVLARSSSSSCCRCCCCVSWPALTDQRWQEAKTSSLSWTFIWNKENAAYKSTIAAKLYNSIIYIYPLWASSW